MAAHIGSLNCVYIEAGVKYTILNCFYFMNNLMKLKKSIIGKLLIKKVNDIYSCFILIGFTDAIDG